MRIITKPCASQKQTSGSICRASNQVNRNSRIRQTPTPNVSFVFCRINSANWKRIIDKMGDIGGCNATYLGPKRDAMYIVIPITVIYVVIFITGIVGNVSTCIVIAKNKTMHTATNYYLFSLAISDLVLLISGLPQEIYSYWSRYPYIFGGTFCFLRGLLAETSGNATVLTITAFTVERYLAICHPFLSHTMSKLSRAVKLILVIWLLSISLAIPQAMQLEVTGECPMCLPTDTVFNHAFEVSTFVFFVAPMTLIVVLYVLIGMSLKSSRIVKRRISTNARVQSTSSKKVVKMLVAVVVAFFICWAPFHIQRLYSIYQQTPVEMMSVHLKIYELLTYISGILYYTSATINPILYNIMSAKFREAFKETFARCCGLRINGLHSKQERSYSALSRSNLRGPDSTDSGSHDHTTVQTNTSSQKNNSLESFNGQQRKSFRLKTSMTNKEVAFKNDQRMARYTLQGVEIRASTPQQSPTYVSVHSVESTSTKLGKFLQLFHCIAKRTLDDSKRLSSYYSAPTREPNILELEKTDTNLERDIFKKCENFRKHCISNSSLKDIEIGAIEDELTTYMKEIRRREYYN